MKDVSTAAEYHDHKIAVPYFTDLIRENLDRIKDINKKLLQDEDRTKPQDHESGPKKHKQIANNALNEAIDKMPLSNT